ncbi:4-diphosphocytidyl-2-C-methyl-D-erythritol kinase [Pannonibacter phragmitetus]|uniref:4-diphosphocytidyl-2-C-methyl-D-erythritol kinase n=1 Tax=Pannonibacter phragmitetus TaxID=121719 RepID=A0A378ZX17_9HYPH|nr:4-(cytidine 5'-diphospho)-2-C-methyl-D-erythritol kinase [Pannonibacter phragmitetus]SUB01618.1 4-diphosphocytidyl-2-C-methyl-D-erythritol kinase [Pannonibacter phragmitetus]
MRGNGTSSGADTAPVFSCQARAKINLALHITGRREDGYHLLDSFTLFAETGDRLSLRAAASSSFTVSGPFAAALEGGGPADSNLVLRAIAALQKEYGQSLPPFAVHLEKNLPVASGIGGGSADAAAALRLVLEATGLAVPSDALQSIALDLGADVPVCLAGRPARMSGIGETLAPLPPLPHCGLVLVNPGVAVSTPAVFRALECRDNPPLPAMPEEFSSRENLICWLKETRNDMQASAIGLSPVIADVLAALEAHPAAEFCRMSGSGATCFALCAPEAAAGLADALRAQHPGWWVEAGEVSCG